VRTYHLARRSTHTLPNTVSLQLHKTFLACAFALGCTSQVVHAAPILATDFGAAHTVVSMGGAGFPQPGAFSFGGLGFSEASTGSGGPGWRNLTSAGYGFTDNAGISDIRIDFGGSFQKVGFDLHVGTADYLTSFFDANDILLGTVATHLNGNRASSFVGWESAAGVARLRILETSGDNGSVGGFDNVRFEAGTAAAVPEPASLALVMAGFAAAVLTARRRKSA